LRIFKIDLPGRSPDRQHARTGEFYRSKEFRKCQLAAAGSVPQRRLPAEDVVVVLGEAVRLVADVLQKA
jgi:hypothetical protein